MEGDSVQFSSSSVTSSVIIPLSVFAMGETMGDPVKRFICSFPDCSASFNKAWKLEVHQYKHTGERPFVCDYEGCGKTFTRSFHLTRHQITHSGEKPFRCPVEGCDEVFPINCSLKRHVARIHEHQGKPYICKYEGCGKSFKKNNQLKSHEYEHTNILPFKCSFEGCDKRFLIPSKLKRHEKVHRGYPCKEDDCSFVGKNWTEYLKHKNALHQELLQCDQCSRTFKRNRLLQEHQRIHQEGRPILHCPREGCQRTYTTPFNLQSHILSFHEEQRPFACPHPGCGKAFAMRQSLQRHGVVHDPEKKKLKIPRPKRSMASRLSGFQPCKDEKKLAQLLQATSLESEEQST
ncbi:general transcription factor IIIA, b [Lepisosteus oculatus]|nr:PREDICTED: transcription factor IIIA [Lepisosteus oculatus]